MCRFLGYLGKPVLMNDLLYAPQNSLIHQSYHALERKDPVNADGFGLGWYTADDHRAPIRYVNIRPAWNDQNLRSLASGARTGCFFGHVRAASVGLVTELNCHPFQYRNLLMMHNGHIEDFKKLKRKLREMLDDEIYDWLSGETDSEHFFALLLNSMPAAARKNPALTDVIDALERAIHMDI